MTEENQAQQPAAILSDWMQREQLALELGVSVDTLRRWQARREGPPCAKIGRHVFYRRVAVHEWLQGRESLPTRRRSR